MRHIVFIITGLSTGSAEMMGFSAAPNTQTFEPCCGASPGGLHFQQIIMFNQYLESFVERN